MAKETPEVIETAAAPALEAPQVEAPAPVETAAPEAVKPAPAPRAPARRSAAKPAESTPPEATVVAAKPAPAAVAPAPVAPKPAAPKPVAAKPVAVKAMPAAADERSFRMSWNLEPYAATALVDTMLDIGAELQSFTAERVREDVATQHRILHCKTPADLIHIQSAFFQKASEDYRAHWGRLAELGNKLAVFPG
ncbi:phasin family protein [Salipiger sp. H15]|uniref:Phasin family protein n=1 Tax=Alloyangia sp. H15 TaxID=3029062 RepID=A0AAU8AIX9_9RHOB